MQATVECYFFTISSPNWKKSVPTRHGSYRERNRGPTRIIHRDGFISSVDPYASFVPRRSPRFLRPLDAPPFVERAPIVLKGNDAAASRRISNDLTKIVSAAGNWHRLHDFLKVNDNSLCQQACRSRFLFFRPRRDAISKGSARFNGNDAVN